MRFAYILLSYLLSPIVVGFLLWRGLNNRAYLARFFERFGFCGEAMPTQCIWVHAVSVGEVQAAVPLVKALLARYPAVPVVVTTVTPTGADRVKQLFGDRVCHCFAPYDLLGSVKRFFNTVQPRLAIIMETELWPNLYHECGRRNVPLVLASARISPRSLSKYRRFVALFREALSHGIVIAAQSESDAERFRALGANPTRTHVTGNIKFDFELPASIVEDGNALRERYAQRRAVWIAGSTHENEEQQVLLAHRRVCEAIPDCVLLLVPRHPERFDGVERLIEEHGFSLVRRTQARHADSDVNVVLVDTLGELPMFYAASDVAFVGGSLVRIGGHNLLEPAALGKPTVTGPHTFNAQDIAVMLLASGATRLVHSPEELADELLRFFERPELRLEAGEKALRTVEENRGALARLLELL
ncbi:MAG: lipid IV(A) 3-deoxy-D-manno-octulosonic acid transferase, partial [Pseudomonadota bacterium]